VTATPATGWIVDLATGACVSTTRAHSPGAGGPHGAGAAVATPGGGPGPSYDAYAVRAVLPSDGWSQTPTPPCGGSEHAGAGGRADPRVGSRAPASAAGEALAWPTETPPRQAGGVPEPSAEAHSRAAGAAAAGAHPTPTPTPGVAGRRVALAEATPTERLTPPPAEAFGLATAAQCVHAHPALRRLIGWAWEDWDVPGPAADRTLLGHQVIGGVLVSVFVQTEHTATARWTALHDCHELAVVHGTVTEVITRITQGLA
jgi:hypothetical protein